MSQWKIRISKGEIIIYFILAAFYTAVATGIFAKAMHWWKGF